MSTEQNNQKAGTPLAEPTGSLVWCRVGDFDVCTWPGDDQQQRAEMQFRGWEHLGRPKCDSIRMANTGSHRPSEPEANDGSVG